MILTFSKFMTYFFCDLGFFARSSRQKRQEERQNRQDQEE